MSECVYCGRKTYDYVNIEGNVVCKKCYYRLWATDEEREEMRKQGYRFAQNR